MSTVNSIGFFTAVKYADQPNSSFQRALEMVDNYFYVSGKKWHVIQDGAIGNKAAVLSGTNSSPLARVIKVISYFTILLPIVMLAAKALLRVCLRSTYNFKVINLEERLAENLDLERAEITRSFVLAKIQNKITDFIAMADGSHTEALTRDVSGLTEYTVVKSGDQCEVTFRADGGPDFVQNYKFTLHLNVDTAKSEQISQEYFANIVKIKEVCFANQLDMIHVPKAKKYTVENAGRDISVIVEERLPFLNSPVKSQQEQSYREVSRDYPENMEKIVRQITTLVSRVDVDFFQSGNVAIDNFPLLAQDRNLPDGMRHRVGVANLKKNAVKVSKFEQKTFSQGLLKLASTPEQIKIINDERVKQKYVSYGKDVRSLRVKEIVADTNLETFYQNKAIDPAAADQPINVVANGIGFPQSLLDATATPVGFDSMPTGPTVTFAEAIDVVVNHINGCIQASVAEDTINARRSLKIDFKNLTDNTLAGYHDLGIVKSFYLFNSKNWLTQILEGLKAHGDIFSFEVDSKNHCYYIQA